MLIQHNGSELKFKVHILSRTRMPNSETQPSIMSHMHCICIFYIYHILIAVSFESILCLFLTTLLTSYVELFISKLTITDYHYLHFVLFLLINHFRYFVCQALDIMTLLEYPLAFYRQTDQSSILCLDSIPYRAERQVLYIFPANFWQ